MRYLLLALVLIIQTGCSSPPYPKIKLDDRYNYAAVKDSSTEAPSYKIKSGEGFILDCSQYNFAAIRKMNNNKNPDMIHFASKGGTYDAALNVTGETVIDAKTMKDITGQSVFPGFKKGDKFVLGIGDTRVVGTEARMATYWVALLEVE